MPPNEAALNKAAKLLDQVELQFFRATPSTIEPFDQSELRWSAKAPIGVEFRLDNQRVSRIGSQVVRPQETRTFKLTAHSGPLSSFLGQVTVSVDLQACTNLFIAESIVQDKLDEVVEGILARHPELTQRAAPFVDVTPTGIVLKLRFEIEVKCSRNPDFNVDAVVGLRIEGTEIVPSFKSFEGSLDYSALEDALNYTVGAFLGLGPQFAIAIAEDNAESEARRDILDGLRAAIDEFLALAPPGSAPSRLDLRDDGIELRLCPLPGFKRVIRLPQSGLTFLAKTTGGTNGGATTGSKTSRVARGRRASGKTAAGRRSPKKTGTKSNHRRGPT